MNILVIGHSYVVDSNRQFWNQVSRANNVCVDIVVPKTWKSNLIKELRFEFNEKTDSAFRNIYPIDCSFKGNGSLYFFNPFQLHKIFRKEKYDLIFVFQETWAISTAEVVLLKMLSRNRATLCYLAVCQNIIKKKLSWMIPWERLVTKGIDRILFCTNEIIKVIEWKKLDCELSYFPFTFDQDIYQFQSKAMANEIVVGYMGRITSEKGILCLVEACKKLLKENYKIKLLIAGNGPLKEQLTDSFIEFVGTLKHTEAHHFYHKINIFVLPSETRAFWKEQFGRVIVESVASGTAIIGSSSGAIPEVLSTLNLNYVFQEGDADDLAGVMKRLIQDMKQENFSEKMVQANELNVKNFSHLSVGKNLISLVQQDLNK